jgi:hypothetical protein
MFVDSFFLIAIDYLGPLCADMIRQNRLVQSEWTELQVCAPIFEAFMTPADSKNVVKNLLHHYQLLEKV